MWGGLKGEGRSFVPKYLVRGLTGLPHLNIWLVGDAILKFWENDDEKEDDVRRGIGDMDVYEIFVILETMYSTYFLDSRLYLLGSNICDVSFQYGVNPWAFESC